MRKSGKEFMIPYFAYHGDVSWYNTLLRHCTMKHSQIIFWIHYSFIALSFLVSLLDLHFLFLCYLCHFLTCIFCSSVIYLPWTVIVPIGVLFFFSFFKTFYFPILFGTSCRLGGPLPVLLGYSLYLINYQAGFAEWMTKLLLLQLINVGFFVCFDSFLSLLTVMPTRIIMICWRFLKTRLVFHTSLFLCSLNLKWFFGISTLQESCVYHLS